MNRPFWQAAALTVLTSAGTGLAAYFTAKAGTADVSQVARAETKADQAWQLTRDLLQAHDDRLDAIQTALERLQRHVDGVRARPSGEPEAATPAAAPAVRKPELPERIEPTAEAVQRTIDNY